MKTLIPLFIFMFGFIGIKAQSDTINKKGNNKFIISIAGGRAKPVGVFSKFETMNTTADKLREIKKGTPAGGVETVIPIDYSAGKRTHIHNKGATTLVIGMMLKGDKVGVSITLAPNEEAKQPFDFYFFNGDALYVTNEGTTIGIYQIDIIS